MIVISAALINWALISKNITNLTKTGNLQPGIPPFRVPNFTISNGTVNVTTEQLFQV